MGSRRKWTKKEEQTLLQGASIYGVKWFQRKMGRSANAILSKARRLYGKGGLTRGSYSLRKASEWTGYHPSQLRRAQAALRQKWKRTSPKGPFLIYEEQLEELVEWLKQDYWNGHHRLYGCLWCDTGARPHYALGLCKRCYQCYVQKLRRKGLPSSVYGLLRIIQDDLKRTNSKLLDKIYNQLVRGRAIDENTLMQFFDCGLT